jgi:hypothetical protein
MDLPCSSDVHRRKTEYVRRPRNTPRVEPYITLRIMIIAQGTR